MLKQRRHRRRAFWIAIAVAGAAVFVALQAPAVAPPDLDRALAAQRELATQRPNDPQVLNDLGNLLVLAGATDEAEASYGKALELAPDMTSARYNLGLLLLQTDRPKQALEEFQKVVKAEPDHAWAHYQIGVIYDQRGSERKAIKEYGKAFRLDPQLAFPEVNPHVIQNRHVTEAMLLAYRDLPVVARVPKAYEEPTRIVDLMVPQVTGESEGTEAAEAPSGGEAGKPGESGMHPAPTYPSGVAGEPGTPVPEGEGQDQGKGEGEGGGEGQRVLREQDLQHGGTVNQVVVPGSVYQPPRGGTRVTPPPVRNSVPQGRVAPGTPSENGRSPGATVPAGRQRFVPGIPSTGRLELQLFPRDEDQTGPAG